MKKPQKFHRRITQTVMIALLMFAVFHSCTPFYIPNPVFAPMFEEAGQIKAIGSVGNSGYGIQAGVSVTDNLGFTFGLSGTEHATEVKGRITEGGLCYYFNDEKLGKVEFLAGAGVGKSEALEGYYFRFNNQIPSSPYNYGNFTRLYLQPGIGHSFDNFELTISSRFSWVNVTQIRSTSYSQNAMNGKIRGFFIEPVFTAGIGSETVKFFFQGGFSFPPYYPRFDFNLLLLEIGIKLSINTLSKKENGQINYGFSGDQLSF